MIAEELLSLHNGEINLYQYLEQKKAEQENSEMNREMGITPQMRRYCRSHGLDDIPDLKLIWKKTKTHYIWRKRET